MPQLLGIQQKRRRVPLSLNSHRSFMIWQMRWLSVSSVCAVVSSMSHWASLATARGIYLWICWNVVCMECIISYSSGSKSTATTSSLNRLQAWYWVRVDYSIMSHWLRADNSPVSERRLYPQQQRWCCYTGVSWTSSRDQWVSYTHYKKSQSYSICESKSRI